MKSSLQKRATALAAVLALLSTSGCWWREAGPAREKTEDALPLDTSTRIDFDSLPERYQPAGFSFARTGGGDEGNWRVDRMKDSENNVLAQISNDGTETRYPVCVYDGFRAADVAVSCRFKTVDGRVDRTAGLVARYLDVDPGASVALYLAGGTGRSAAPRHLGDGVAGLGQDRHHGGAL